MGKALKDKPCTRNEWLILTKATKPQLQMCMHATLPCEFSGPDVEPKPGTELCVLLEELVVRHGRRLFMQGEALDIEGEGLLRKEATLNPKAQVVCVQGLRFKGEAFNSGLGMRCTGR